MNIIKRIILFNIFSIILYSIYTIPAHAWYEYTPSITTTPVFEDNDCLYPGQVDEDSSTDDILCISPSPIQSGGESPQPSNPHTDTTQSPGSPTCTIPFDAPILQGFQITSPGVVNWSWWGVTGIDKYSIRYGYAPDALVYGEDNIPSSSTAVETGFLIPGNHVYAIVSAWKNGCSEDSNLLDPTLP